MSSFVLRPAYLFGAVGEANANPAILPLYPASRGGVGRNGGWCCFAGGLWFLWGWWLAGRAPYMGVRFWRWWGGCFGRWFGRNGCPFPAYVGAGFEWGVFCPIQSFVSQNNSKYDVWSMI